MRLLLHGRTLLTTASRLLALSVFAYLPAPRAQEFSEGPLNMKVEGAPRWSGLLACAQPIDQHQEPGTR